MSYDYMGYGDIFGGLFDNKMFSDKGLYFKSIFDINPDSIVEELNLTPVKPIEIKLFPENIKKKQMVVCVNCYKP
jgi:hypothetical protein